MLSSLRRVSDRFASEASAWLGAREKLAFYVVRTVNGNDLKQYFDDFPDPHIMLRRVLPVGLDQQLIEAVRGSRKILCLFLIDRTRAIGDEYVITIDLDRGRVDRALSSPQLLLDPWLKKEQSTYYGYLAPSGFMQHVNWFDLLDAPFAPFGGRPFRNRYERAFLKRQEKITELFGHSRRFESLLFCLAPQLDPETRVRLKSGMRSLWEYECLLRQKVTFAEAEQALSAAHLDVTLVEVEREDVMGDSETLLQNLIWTDANQNMIARGEVCRTLIPNEQPLVGIYVFGEFFCRENAERLLNCFHTRTETDLRAPSKKTVQDAAQPS